MSYLRNHEVTFEPIESWPGDETAERRRSPFRTHWSATLHLLDHELYELDADRVVFQVELPRHKIRQDGAPRAGATIKEPGVIVSFDSLHGPVSYPCDRFNHWQDNVRAIALALEALRKVDRYGITRRGEQYKGFQQLPSPSATVARTPADGFPDNQSAWDAIRRFANCDKWEPIPSHEKQVATFRLAQQMTHPDRPNGDEQSFKWVQAAGKQLGLI